MYWKKNGFFFAKKRKGLINWTYGSWILIFVPILLTTVNILSPCLPVDISCDWSTYFFRETVHHRYFSSNYIFFRETAARQVIMLNYNRFISRVSAARQPSIIRELLKILSVASEDMIPLSGGLPNPEQFPFKDIQVRNDPNWNLTTWT